MPHTLSEAGAKGIRQAIDTATSDPNTKIPGFVFVAVNKEGEQIFSHASGKRGANSDEPMTLDTIFWIASCTKMIAGIAAMQLVEQGKLSLDDPDQAENLAPELKRAKLVKSFNDGKLELVEKKGRITLRQLLSHTAGFGYSFFNPEIKSTGVNEFSGKIEDVNTPLLFEPGTSWNYGTNIDWAGVLVERVSGLTLNDYFQKNIFAPLGIKNINMFPTAEMKSKLAHMHARDKDGNITEREHLQLAPLKASSPDGIFNSAGAGCFAQPSEYTKIIATLLNDGTSPTTGKQILKKATVDEMFSNQIPEFPNFGRQPIADAMPDLTNPIGELYPQPHDQPQGWGLTFMLTISEGATGRGRNTGWWAGLANLFWWADREKGVGGMVASQILPFADGQVMGLWAQVESQIYQG